MEGVKKEALELHKRLRGKIEIGFKSKIRNSHDLSLVYTPGVGAVSSAIADDQSLADQYTWRKNTVAIVTDGSAVLGLGNIGPEAALPVMEGKSVIFKQFAHIDAVPIVLGTQDTKEIIRTVQYLAPGFGAIQLEDISAPRCFEIERVLMKTLSIPVMHDDQHGTSIVVGAGFLNALKIVGKSIDEIRIAISGAGAAGVAIVNLLIAMGVRSIVATDSKGVIHPDRSDLTAEKKKIAEQTQPNVRGGLLDAIQGTDIFIGISKAGLLTSEMVKNMNPDPVIFALANPVPEIMPDYARLAGVRIIATGRSDFPNQINNALCYPGLFRGMLDTGVTRVTDEIKIRAARAIADFVPDPTPERFIPSMFDEGLHEAVASSVTPSSF